MESMFATRWELFTDQRNPIALVRIKGGSKRRQGPMILTVEQFELVVASCVSRIARWFKSPNASVFA